MRERDSVDTTRRRRRMPLALALIAALVAGCGTAAPVSSTPARAATFEEFATGICAAFDSLFRAVGNPDTAAGSELSNALKAAAERGDAAAAAQLAGQITAELEAGRGHAAYAAGWAPGEAMAQQADRLLLAFEAWTAAHVAAARREPGATDPQAAFEAAGGLEAWQGMLEAAGPVASSRPAVPPHECPNVPVSL